MQTGASKDGSEARYTPRPRDRYGDRHVALEPIDELLETRVMARILDEVVHGMPVDSVAARTEEERAFARRVRADVERTLAETPDEGCTSYVEWALEPDLVFGPGSAGSDSPGSDNHGRQAPV